MTEEKTGNEKGPKKEEKINTPPAITQTTKKDFWRNFLLFLMFAWLALFVSTLKPSFLTFFPVTLAIYAIRYWYKSVPATSKLIRTGIGKPKVGRAMFMLPYLHQITEIPTQKYEIRIKFGKTKKKKEREEEEEENEEALPPFPALDSLVNGKIQAYIGVEIKDTKTDADVDEPFIKAAESIGDLLEKQDGEKEERERQGRADQFFREMLQSATREALIDAPLDEVHKPDNIRNKIIKNMMRSCEPIGFMVYSINVVRLQQTPKIALEEPDEQGEYPDVYTAQTAARIAEDSAQATVTQAIFEKTAQTVRAEADGTIALARAERFKKEQQRSEEQARVEVVAGIEKARGDAESVIQNARGKVESSKLNQTMEAQMEAFRRVTLAASEKEVMRHVTNAADFLKKSGIVSDTEINKIVQARITWEYAKMFPDGATRDAILKSMGMDVDKIRALAKPLESANINIIGGPELAESVAKIPAFARGAEMAVEQIPMLQKLLSSVANMINTREGKVTPEEK